MTKITLLAITAFAALCLQINALEPVPQTADHFAILSPQIVKGLKGLDTTPEGQHIISQANKDLHRPPGAIPVIHVEGTLPHQGLWDVSLKAIADWPIINEFAFAYALTGNHEYLDAEDRYLNAWVDVYKISLNPIDETGLDTFINAYDMTRAALPTATQEKMNNFLRTMATSYLDSIEKMKAMGKEDNRNWQSHRIKLVVMSSYAIGDKQLIDRARVAFMRQVAMNIAPSGEVSDFTNRDAIHYVTYDLEPLICAALAAKAHGEDWFHKKMGTPSSIEGAMDWLTPYALGEKTHAEFVHSKIGFDAQRAKVGMKGYAAGTKWDRLTSTGLYQLASLADAKYNPVFENLAQSGGHTQGGLTLFYKAGLRP